MAKTYDLSKKSDMRKFAKDLERDAMDLAKESICENGIEIECPHCGKTISVVPGLNTCAFCNNEIDVNLDL